MTTYEKIKNLNDYARRMSGMYYHSLDQRSQQIGNEHELMALALVKELKFEDNAPEAEREYQDACNHFAYFRKLKYKAYVAANRESPAFDYAYSISQEDAEKSLKNKIGNDSSDLLFWTVFVHPDGEEEKLPNIE